ncbi:MAG: sigma-70 family RNA polymerase sigma factor [Lacipirellulaceae bacterium]
MRPTSDSNFERSQTTSSASSQPGSSQPASGGEVTDRGVTEEFYQLLTQHQSRLRGFVRCLLFNAAEVDDVLQETNVILLRKARGFQPGTNFWAWASTVARYEVLSHFKRLGRNKHVLNSELMQELVVVVEERLENLEERRSALSECFEKLTPARRQLLEMRYSLGHSIAAIAETTQRPAGSIRQTLYRIRQTLMACISARLKAGQTPGI